MPGVDPSPAAVVRPASIPELDGARAVAALGVFVFHAATAATPLNKHVFRLTAILNSGVGVFFVLSGFLIYRPFCEANIAGLPVPDLARYLVRRVLRIYPAYLVCLVIWWRFGIVEILGVRGFLKHASLLDMYWAPAQRGGAGLEVAWTLQIEMTFYLLAPLFAILVRLAGAGLRRLTDGRVQQAALEMVATLTLAVAGVLAIPWHSPEAHTLVRLMLPWMGVGAAAMIVWLGLTTVNGWFCVFCMSPQQHVLQDRLTVWHQPIINAVPKRWYALHGPWASFATISLELGLSLIAAAISFRFVERPGILLGRRFRGLRRSGRVTPVSRHDLRRRPRRASRPRLRHRPPAGLGPGRRGPADRPAAPSAARADLLATLAAGSVIGPDGDEVALPGGRPARPGRRPGGGHQRHHRPAEGRGARPRRRRRPRPGRARPARRSTPPPTGGWPASRCRTSGVWAWSPGRS